VQKSLEELERSDLVPFRRAIEGGVDMIMTAHVAFALAEETDDEARREPEIGRESEADEATIPASFDPRIMRGVLRERLGFQGVVITDALGMEGARSHVQRQYRRLVGGFERAILAGADLLLYSSPVPDRIVTQKEGRPMIAAEVIQTIIDTLDRVVDRDRIDRKVEAAAERHQGLRNVLRLLDESEARIADLRARAKPPGGSRAKSEGKVISLRDYSVTPAIYREAAGRSIALVRDPQEFLPLIPGARCALLPVSVAPSGPLKRQDLRSFADELCKDMPGLRALPMLVGFEEDEAGESVPVLVRAARTVVDASRYDPRSLQTGDALALSPQEVLLPVFSARGGAPEGFLGNLQALLSRHECPFVIVTGWPIIEWIPEDTGCLLTFGASPHVASALQSILRGEKKPRSAPSGVFPRA